MWPSVKSNEQLRDFFHVFKKNLHFFKEIRQGQGPSVGTQTPNKRKSKDFDKDIALKYVV